MDLIGAMMQGISFRNECNQTTAGRYKTNPAVSMNNRFSLIFIFIMGFAVNANAQCRTRWEPRNYIFCGETDYALFTKRGKKGLYHVPTKTQVIKENLNFYYFASAFNYLFEVEGDTIRLYNLGHNSDQVCVTACIRSTGSMILNNYKNGFDAKAIRLVNGSHGYVTDTGNGLIIDGIVGHALGYEAEFLAVSCAGNDAIGSLYDEQYSLGVELFDDFVIISDYLDTRNQAEPVPLESTEYPGEDSIRHGLVVYQEFNSGHQRSGVYNRSTHHWDIPRDYIKIYRVNDVLIGLHDGQGGMYYDVFVLHNHQIRETRFNKITANRQVPGGLLFEDREAPTVIPDSINFSNMPTNTSFSYDADSTIIYFRDKTTGKTGLIHFQLFTEQRDLTGNALPGAANFRLDTIFPPEYEFVQKLNKDATHFVAYNDGVFSMKVDTGGGLVDFPMTWTLQFYRDDYYWADDPYYVDGRFFKDTCPNSYCLLQIQGKSRWIPDSPFLGIDKLNDSLIYINCNSINRDGDLRPIPSIEFPGEDSMSANNEVLYYARLPKECTAGIYNLNSKTWLFDRKYRWIRQTPAGFLTCEPVNDGSRNDWYSFRKFSGEYVFKDVSYVESMADPVYAKYRINYEEVDTVYPAAQLDDYYWYYFESSGKTGIASLYGGIIHHEPVEFLYLNSKLDLTLQIRNRTIFLESNYWTDSIAISENTDLSIWQKEREDYWFIDKLFYLYEPNEESNAITRIAMETTDKDGRNYVNHTETGLPGDLKIIQTLQKNQPWKYHVKALSDSVVYVENWMLPFTERNYRRIYDITKPGGYYRSGIYNIYTETWLIKHECVWIRWYADGTYLLCKPVFNGSGVKTGERYSVADRSGRISIGNVERGMLPKKYAF
jgi:hypothetical protein